MGFNKRVRVKIKFSFIHPSVTEQKSELAVMAAFYPSMAMAAPLGQPGNGSKNMKAQLELELSKFE